MKFVFVIQTNYAGVERVFTVVATDLAGACQRMHKHLFAEDPTMWSADWLDLLEDVEEGNQTCYGPFEDIPELT